MSAAILSSLSGSVMPSQPPRVLIIGGGPVGLEAAVSCSLSGFAVTLCEKGSTIGSAVQEWGHVKLFSSNSINCSPHGLQVLSELGEPAPDPAECPTGAAFSTTYLEPLARWLEQQPDCEVLLDASVQHVTRGSLLKGEAIKAVGATARDDTPFSALVEMAGEESSLDGFAAVVDCSGTFGNSNFLGRGGAPAIGERKLRDEAHYRAIAATSSSSARKKSKASPLDCFFDRLPDVLGADMASFLPPPGTAPGAAPPSVTVVLVGGGYSAATTLRSLLELGASRAGEISLEIEWLLRKPSAAGAPYAVVEDDPLPSRELLVSLANNVAAGTYTGGGSTIVRVHRGTSITAVHRDTATGRLVIRATSEGASEIGSPEAFELEEFELRPQALVSHVGYRPSYDLARELQVHVCYASEGPMKLAASLLAARVAAESSGDAAAAGDCLKQAAPGPELLTTPEPRFHILGSKSYGRSSSFLLMIGHKQVEAVVGMLKADLLV